LYQLAKREQLMKQAQQLPGELRQRRDELVGQTLKKTVRSADPPLLSPPILTHLLVSLVPSVFLLLLLLFLTREQDEVIKKVNETRGIVRDRAETTMRTLQENLQLKRREFAEMKGHVSSASYDVVHSLSLSLSLFLFCSASRDETLFSGASSTGRSAWPTRSSRRPLCCCLR
jgi:hypothetical protein